MAPIADETDGTATDADADGASPSQPTLLDMNHQDDHPSLLTSILETVAPRESPSKENRANGSSSSADEVAYSSGVVPLPATAAAATSTRPSCVQCQHCGKMTPIDGPSSTNKEMKEEQPTTPATNHPNAPPNTPAFPATNDAINNNNYNNALLEANIHNELQFFQNEVEVVIMSEEEHLEHQVLQASRDTNLANNAQSSEMKIVYDLFQQCAAPPKPPKKGCDGKPIPVQNKNIKKMSKMLGKQPALILGRSVNMLSIPDGFTVLHAACHAGNVETVRFLLENYVDLTGGQSSSSSSSSSDGDGGGVVNDKGGERKNVIKLDLNERDTQGRTALHIAALQGHFEVIALLRSAYQELQTHEDELELAQTKLAEEDDDSSDSDDEADAEGALVETMAKLSTSNDTKPTTDDTTTKKAKQPTTAAVSTPKTPKSKKSPMRRRRRSPMPTPGSKSPMPPRRRSPMRSPLRRSPVRSPTFSGPNAPVDLSGRTPLGYAATSSELKAKKHRPQLEAELYKEGDRSLVGERTPPLTRCGPRRNYLSPNNRGGGGSGRKVVFNGEETDGSNIVTGTNSYLSPTPRKGRYSNTPGSVASSMFATPFSSPPTIPEEGDEVVNNSDIDDNPLGLQWAASDMNGWRINMEDKMLAKYPIYGEEEILPSKPSTLDAVTTTPTMGLFGVFDGHGDGGFASDFIATNLESVLKSQPEWSLAYWGCNHSYLQLTIAWTQACYDLDKLLKEDETNPRNGGTTAIMAMVVNKYMVVSNVGDSRAILLKKRLDEESDEVICKSQCWESSTIQVLAMSEDHKPDLPEERARIEAAGLTVQTDHVPPDDNDENGEYTTVYRVKKSDKELLGVARAFGDYDYKSNEELSVSRQAVVCTPEIVVRERKDDEDMYLILACDGIWDVMSNDEVGLFVARRVAELLGWTSASAGTESTSNELPANKNTTQGEVLARVGDDLLAECLRKGSRDNMSVMIVALPASGLTTTNGVATISSPSAESKGDGTVRALAYE